MHRREFLVKLASFAMCGFSGGTVVGASEFCQWVGPRFSRCRVGIDEERLSFGTQQQSSKWCWAACIEMVFAYYGYNVSQSRIVRETWGTILDKPVHERQLIDDLNRGWMDEHGRHFRSSADFFDKPAAGVSDLRKNRPLILGTRGHTVVLTAITLETDEFTGQWRIVEAAVSDPWPGRGARTLSSEEWRDVRFAARVLLHGV
jgi:hypothetical protein